MGALGGPGHTSDALIFTATSRATCGDHEKPGIPIYPFICTFYMHDSLRNRRKSQISDLTWVPLLFSAPCPLSVGSKAPWQNAAVSSAISKQGHSSRWMWGGEAVSKTERHERSGMGQIQVWAHACAWSSDCPSMLACLLACTTCTLTHPALINATCPASHGPPSCLCPQTASMPPLAHTLGLGRRRVRGLRCCAPQALGQASSPSYLDSTAAWALWQWSRVSRVGRGMRGSREGVTRLCPQAVGAPHR